jgi:predicted amidohydrolase YtcJ
VIFIRRFFFYSCFIVLYLVTSTAFAKPIAERVLFNGKIVLFDGSQVEALAIGQGIILGLGTTEQMRSFIGLNTQQINLHQSTVVPGLIDSHIHAIRAGLSFQSELSWMKARTIQEALREISQAAKVRPKGTWLVIAGGWIEAQFTDGRKPSQAELIAAAPDHHLYIQEQYSSVFISPKGIAKLGLDTNAELFSRLQVEINPTGRVTGWLTGNARTISDVYELLPPFALSDQLQGTKLFFEALNRYGITGVIDPGGYNLPLQSYNALFRLWREKNLTIRVNYSLSAPRKGYELADFKELTTELPMGFGDDFLKFNGIGENVTWGMYNNERPIQTDKDTLRTVLAWAIEKKLTVTFHWHFDESVHHLFEVIDELNAQEKIKSLRWSIAHLNNISDQTLMQMKRLGIGWLVQNAMYYRTSFFKKKYGLEQLNAMPLISKALAMDIAVGGGTDAHRVMSFNPFIALQWMIDGRSVDGQTTRIPNHLLSRIDALKIYTKGSAWFINAEDMRGELAVGKFADLAVLNSDYYSIPTDQIKDIESLLTIVGGNIVYQSGIFQDLQ